MVSDKIFTARRDCGAQAAERKPARPQVLGRILARLLHGGPDARSDRADSSGGGDGCPFSGAIDFAGRNDRDGPGRQPFVDGSIGVGSAVLDQRHHEHRTRRGQRRGSRATALARGSRLRACPRSGDAMVARTRDLDRCRLFQRRHSRSGNVVCPELLAASLPAWTASRRALNPEITEDPCVTFLRWCLPRLQLRWPGYRKVRPARRQAPQPAAY